MISATLTVLKKADGTAHFPDGVQQTISLQSTDGNSIVSDDSLSVVLLANVSGTVQEVAAYVTGAIGVTKITDKNTGQSVYVKEIIWDVSSAQHPCCDGTSDPLPTPITISVGASASNIQVTSALVYSSASASDGSPIATYLWELTSKPSGAPDPIILSPATSSTYVNGMVPGNYTFRITATAGGVSNNATATFHIYNTILLFSTGDEDTGGSVTGTITPGTTNGNINFQFDSISSPTGTPVDMTMYHDSVSAGNFVMTVSYPSDYATHVFRITKADGQQSNSIFLSATGDKILP